MQFTDPDVLKVIKSSISNLRGLSLSEKSTKVSRDLIVEFFEILIKDPALISDNMSNVSKQVIPNLIKKIQNFTITDSEVNISFSIVYRIIIDVGILGGNDTLEYFYESCKRHSFESYPYFDEKTQIQIDYVNRSLPTDILKNITNSHAFIFYKEVSSQFKDIEQKKSNWEEYISDQKEKVDALHAKLVEQENGYNFVGLYKGFDEINEEKKTELRVALLVMLFFGLAMVAFAGFDVYYFAFGYTFSGLTPELYKIIPCLTLMVILVYFFRISLFHFRSIKTQIIQLRLRMSLCQFIQSYADYSKDIHKENKELLTKFEAIIFSNVMSSEDKIPSAYDGIEQIAALIDSIKKK